MIPDMTVYVVVDGTGSLYHMSPPTAQHGTISRRDAEALNLKPCPACFKESPPRPDAFNWRLRANQCGDPTVGTLFQSLYRFFDRTNSKWFGGMLPLPAISLDKDVKNRRGFYAPKSGFGFSYHINLNPWELRSGLDAVETLAHEMIHQWEDVQGMYEGNTHSDHFIARAMSMGLDVTESGYHRGYRGDRWEGWMDTNADLELAEYALPGMDPEVTVPDDSSD